MIRMWKWTKTTFSLESWVYDMNTLKSGYRRKKPGRECLVAVSLGAGELSRSRRIPSEAGAVVFLKRNPCSDLAGWLGRRCCHASGRDEDLAEDGGAGIVAGLEESFEGQNLLDRLRFVPRGSSHSCLGHVSNKREREMEIERKPLSLRNLRQSSRVSWEMSSSVRSFRGFASMDFAEDNTPPSICSPGEGEGEGVAFW